MPRIWLECFLAALKLGLTSFGGPTAHIGFFRQEYVVKRQWLDDRRFADLIALCQLLPGPASSQAGFGIGLLRGGIGGAAAAWLGFTLPSAVAMGAFAYLYGTLPVTEAAGWIRGLQLAAVAIVAGAVLGMARALAPDRPRATIAVAAAAAALLMPNAIWQLAVMAAAAAIGIISNRGCLPENAGTEAPGSRASAATGKGSRSRISSISLALFAILLFVLPVLRALYPDHLLQLFESFYRSGALVFGGGHVVLPLLERETVPAGWIAPEQFVAGYAAAQAMPGPLFTFSAFLGAAFGGWPGAIIAVLAIFLPGLLLVAGVLPFWSRLREARSVQGALYGINAAVVGILLAALFNPLFTHAVGNSIDFSLLAVLYLLMQQWKCPPWALVSIGAAAGIAIYGL